MISSLVASLPEVYQPIFGYPELSERVSRPCHDRLQRVNVVHDALLSLLGRPLKILDLGCAQGFFSFSLAERGAIVHGVDFLDKNIALCNALASERPDLQVSFETGRIEEVVAGVEPGQYDLVLGLSVFHHIVFERGADEVRRMLANAARHSGVLLIEVALHDEPLYWGGAQPKDPRSLFDSIAFVHELARHGTHLAPIPRPLYVASNRYWLLDGVAGRFETWSDAPHVFAHGVYRGSRRYFFGANEVAKIYRLDHELGACNRSSADRERNFFENIPAGLHAPECLVAGENESEAWIVLERLPGRLLIDLLREGVSVDRRRVLLEVLDQCAALEAAGLYHDDVRTWNVLVADDGAVHLIDYGSISSKAEDCVWPRNPFLAFFIFVREVATGVVDDPDPLRTISISPFGLPEPYRAWAISLWDRPMTEWSFGLMRNLMQRASLGSPDAPSQKPLQVWMTAVEEAMQAQKVFANHLRQQIGAGKLESQQALQAVVESHSREVDVLGRSIALLEKLLHGSQAHVEILEKQLACEEERLRRSECRYAELEALLREQADRAADAELNAHLGWIQADQWHGRVLALHRSNSWRITAPLRAVHRIAAGDLTPVRRVGGFVLKVARAVLRVPALVVARTMLTRPAIYARVAAALRRYPQVLLHLDLFVQNAAQPSAPRARGRVESGRAAESSTPKGRTTSTIEGEVDLSTLSENTRNAYLDLLAAIAQRRKGGV